MTNCIQFMADNFLNLFIGKEFFYHYYHNNKKMHYTDYNTNIYNSYYNYNNEYHQDEEDIDYNFSLKKLNEKKIIKNMPIHIQCKNCKCFVIQNKFHICEKLKKK